MSTPNDPPRLQSSTPIIIEPPKLPTQDQFESGLSTDLPPLPPTPNARCSNLLSLPLSSSPPVGFTDLPSLCQLDASASNGSVGNDTARRKVSFDSLRNLHQAPVNLPFRPDSHLSSLHIARTRGLRHPHERPFVPVNPFTMTLLSLSASTSTHDAQGWCEYNCCLPFPVPCPSPKMSKLRKFFAITQDFMTNVFLRQLYLHLLLRLPSLYFSRVARIFQDAEVSLPDIQRMIGASGPQVSGSDRAMGTGGSGGSGLASGAASVSDIGASFDYTGQLPAFSEDWTPPAVSPALARFKNSWEAFIDSLLREWKTQNIVSALLLSAILTIFQIPSAASDPLIRTTALLSLICALMSLSFGCIYIVRFGAMRSMYKASRWAEEARKRNTMIFWNVWVLLAMPAIWLAWSMLLFVTSILAFVWRFGSTDNSDQQQLGLPPNVTLGTRIALTCVFGLGMIYFVLIVKTMRSYGDPRNRCLLWAMRNASNGGSIGRSVGDMAGAAGSHANIGIDGRGGITKNADGDGDGRDEENNR